ncbi:MAG: substrate-binding domain-containing protein [Bdellovibrionales bacterium]|nr:substrate-binding domain-containing protein [Bdellovibrionales bacterium]
MNIVYAAKNTGEAEKKWNEDKTIDAWLVFNIWGTRNPDTAEIVKTEPELTIYRSMGTALAKGTKQKALAEEFVKYLEADSCRKIFVKEGWSQ